MKRYPLAPLADACGNPCDADLADLLGIHRTTVVKYRAKGMDEATADTLACRAAVPTLALWPDWGAEALAKAQEAMVECADEKCDQRFVPGYGRIYCSNRCRGRAVRRRQRQDPETKARFDEQNRRYREQSRQALRAYKRRYYQQNRERILELQRQRQRKEAS